MGGEANAEARLVYGIEICVTELKARMSSRDNDNEEYMEDLINSAMAEDSGLELIVPHSYWQTSEHEEKKYLIISKETREMAVACAGDTSVAITTVPDTLPKVIIKKELVLAVFANLKIQPPKDVLPKWMLVNSCQMME
jgi:hypothetical protein